MRPKDLMFYIELIIGTTLTLFAASMWIEAAKSKIENHSFTKKYLVVGIISTLISIPILYLAFSD